MMIFQKAKFILIIEILYALSYNHKSYQFQTVFYNQKLMQKQEGFIPDNGQKQLFQIYLKDQKQPKLVLTLAPPGAGKTTAGVQLFKAIYNNRKKSSIKRMLFLTFTKRTRTDILKKFKKDGFLQKHPFIHRIVRSFHSLAYSSLFWESIITETDIKRKIKEIAAEANLQVEGNDQAKVNRLIKQINQAISRGQIKQKIELYQERNQTYAVIFQKYIDWLEQCFEESLSISYDYSLIKLEQKIKNNEYPHMIDLSSLDLLIVDEFQDSNPAQMKIIRAIIQRNPQMKLLLLGDIDQTIYTWRGADLVYLEQLIEEYQEREEYKNVYLQNTHRLGSEVVDISQKLINHRPRYQEFRKRHYQDKVPIPLNKENNHATEVRQFQSQFSEVYWVYRKIKQLTKEGLRYRDMTVLLRSFKLTSFVKKFQFLNEKIAKQTGEQLIPITMKTDEVNSSIKNVLAWIVYFYKKKYFAEESAKQQIKIILESMNPKQSTVNKMISGNKIDKEYLVSRNLTLKQQQDWDIFFIDFKEIANKIAQNVQKQRFCEVFKSIFELLLKKQIIQQANPNDIEQFLDFTKIIESSLDHQYLNSFPTYSIIQQLIIRKYYMIDRDRKKNSKGKKKIQGEKQWIQYDIFGKPVPKAQKKNDFFKLVLSKVGKLKRQSMLSQQEQTQALRKKQEYYSQKQKKQIQFTNEQDSVHFQTTFKCKGLQYKVVFIVAMNYDIFQQPFESIPRLRRPQMNDANRERQLSKQLTRKMLRDEQQLRVVYTALTRTSKYSYVSSSKTHNRSYNQGIKHPHFEFLQREAKISLPVPFDLEQDKKFKDQYSIFFQENNGEQREQVNKHANSNKSLYDFFLKKH